MFLVIHWDVEDDTDEDMESRSREEISEDLNCGELIQSN